MKRSILAAALCCAALPAAAQESAPRVYELAEVETRPVPENMDELRTALDASYPADKRAAGQGARVSVSFVLDTEGVPGELRVLESSDAAFDSVTVIALSMLRFRPARVAGQAVPVRVEVPVEWQPGPVAEAAPASAAPAEEALADEEAGGEPTYTLETVERAPEPSNLTAFRRELERLYPRHLRDAGIGGMVHTRFVVTAEGKVEDVLITRTSDLRFNVITVQALQALRFRPARVAGRPVRAWVELPIEWNSVARPIPQQNFEERY